MSQGCCCLFFFKVACTSSWQSTGVNYTVSGVEFRAEWSSVKHTSFLSSWGRCVALSSGKPGTSVVVRTCLLLSSSITSGTQKKGWSSSSSLPNTQQQSQKKRVDNPYLALQVLCYSTVQKSWATFFIKILYILYFASKGPDVFVWSWAIILRPFWRAFKVFSLENLENWSLIRNDPNRRVAVKKPFLWTGWGTHSYTRTGLKIAGDRSHGVLHFSQ